MTRPTRGPPAAPPLDWCELGDRRVPPQRYNVKNIRRRLGRREDAWADISRHGHALAAVAKRLGRLAARAPG